MLQHTHTTTAAKTPAAFRFLYCPVGCLAREMGLRATPMVYRNLLKAVEKHIGKEEHKVHFTDFIREEFRKKRNLELEDPSFIQQRIKLAQSYTYLLNSVHHHKDLLFSYNIAVDRSNEMTKVLGKSAASVGLRLPDVYQS